MQTVPISQSETKIVTRENGVEVTRTCTVFTRHSNDCKHVEDNQYQKCECNKSLLKYSSLEKSNWRESAKTRKWSEAQRQATDWLNSFHPDKAELRAKEQEIARLNGTSKNKKIPTVQEAIGLFIADLRTQNLEEKTVRNYVTLFGDVDPNTGDVKLEGHLLPWLNTQNLPQPVLITDITAEVLTRWRLTWKKWNDLTQAKNHTRMNAFFKFCQVRWFADRPNPADAIKRPKVDHDKKRTAAFSNAQYEKIEKAAASNPRLLAFVELMRWSGMAGVDATLFKLNSITDNAVEYKRKKTGKRAGTTLPADVVERLKNVPLEKGATREQPFRYPDMELNSNIDNWRREFQAVCEPLNLGPFDLGDGEETTDKPGLHMLRDTCAVWWLQRTKDIQLVADILGDTIAMVEKHYKPWTKEMKKTHANKTREILAASGAD